MKKVITTPDPRLRQKSEKIHEIDAETQQIIADMTAASLAWENEHPYELSAAMAAPQLGINKRIIIVRDDLSDKATNTFTALINPEVIKTEGKIIKDYEGCLSVPEIYGMVGRPRKVKVKALLEDGTEVRIKAEDYLARTLLHEIDHLDGVLFIDHIKDDPKAFYRLDENGDLKPLDYATVRENPNLFPEED
ncbi:MAG: peptide deformylase [Candidatus Saccharibacteria bacterium]|nr:peptide deformylase [Candidatus Saccharibacteria bacterium]